MDAMKFFLVWVTYCYGTPRTHKVRIEEFRNSTAGEQYLQNKAQVMEAMSAQSGEAK
jgi:hypothetical protein